MNAASRRSADGFPVPACVGRISADLANVGADLVIAGGWVRDRLLGVKPRDLDLEVFCATPEVVWPLFRARGKLQQVGRAFPIHKWIVRGRAFDTCSCAQAAGSCRTGLVNLARTHNVGFRCAMDVCERPTGPAVGGSHDIVH